MFASERQSTDTSSVRFSCPTRAHARCAWLLLLTMTAPAIVHDARFYLVDGDLAICSGPSPDGQATVFRIHKAVMAYNSPIFHGMLDMPGDPVGQEMHDGVPIVRVTDTADEVHALLAALYDPG